MKFIKFNFEKSALQVFSKCILLLLYITVPFRRQLLIEIFNSRKLANALAKKLTRVTAGFIDIKTEMVKSDASQSNCTIEK